MRAEAPKRILVGSQLAEVQSLRVDVVDVAKLAGIDEVVSATTPGWYSSRWPTISTRSRSLRERRESLAVFRALRQGLLDKAVLAGRDHLLHDRQRG